jgi:hypothetical protein
MSGAAEGIAGLDRVLHVLDFLSATANSRGNVPNCLAFKPPSDSNSMGFNKLMAVPRGSSHLF